MTSLLQSSTFIEVFRLAFLEFEFLFLGPAAKMPRTTASRDDAAVGKNVPSTTADLPNGTGTTHAQRSAPASSSNVDDAGSSRGGAMISRPSPKFSIRKLAVKRASA